MISRRWLPSSSAAKDLVVTEPAAVKEAGLAAPAAATDAASATAPASVEAAPLSDAAVVAPPVHAPGVNGDAALAEKVANLDVKDGEAVKTAA